MIFIRVSERKKREEVLAVQSHVMSEISKASRANGVVSGKNSTDPCNTPYLFHSFLKAKILIQSVRT